jgi:hypothetical protein
MKMTLLYALAAIGAVTMARWARERWRTRHDKGYPWMGGRS